MKSVTRAVQDEVWSQSLSRSSREIYADDRRKQREASRNWAPDTLEIMAKRIKERESVGHNYLWGRQALEMIEKTYSMSQISTHTAPHTPRLLRHTYSEPAAEAMLKRLVDQHDRMKSDVASQK